MPRHAPPTDEEIRSTARATADALRGLGYQTCFFGGVACRLYGTTRTPGDVDIVILNCTLTQESLKALLVGSNRNFYLVASKDPHATYKVLWYRLSTKHSCKVDLLQPGIMNIPDISPSHIEFVDSLPLMPFSLVLLLKLQGWADHCVAAKPHHRKKQHTDVADVDALLQIAIGKNLKPWNDSFIPTTLLRAAQDRVKEYVVMFPRSREYWRTLGFEVPEAPQFNPRNYNTFRDEYDGWFVWEAQEEEDYWNDINNQTSGRDYEGIDDSD